MYVIKTTIIYHFPMHSVLTIFLTLNVVRFIVTLTHMNDSVVRKNYVSMSSENILGIIIKGLFTADKIRPRSGKYSDRQL